MIYIIFIISYFDFKAKLSYLAAEKEITKYYIYFYKE